MNTTNFLPLNEGWLHVVYFYSMKVCLYWIHVCQLSLAFKALLLKHAATQRTCTSTCTAETVRVLQKLKHPNR